MPVVTTLFTPCLELLKAKAFLSGRGVAALALAVALSTPLVAGEPNLSQRAQEASSLPGEQVTLNRQDDGYRGIWYQNEPTGDQYKYKYSGGLGTYCDYHRPMAIYSSEADKTFFCYGGASHDSSQALWHMVSYFDHKTKTVPRPTILLDKQTSDAHDNPVLSIDKKGYIWVFSAAHGLGRPSYIHRSVKPYDITEFKQLSPTHVDGKQEVPLDNFSYPQFWYDERRGFVSFFTRYKYPAARTSCFMTSEDGVHWSQWQRLAAIDEGHYQISAVGRAKMGAMMNYHPRGKGLNGRTNLYYIETINGGHSWQAAEGQPVTLPLTDPHNPALVRDYESERQLVYIKDLVYDAKDNPVLVYETSAGFAPGPQNNPRLLRLAHWMNAQWQFNVIAQTDHNYDSAALYIEDGGSWRLFAPTEPGPQPYCTGGEMVVWRSEDQGKSWTQERQLTHDSVRNHTFARRPLNAHPDFYALWADGDAHQPSESRLYFANRQGQVFELPNNMKSSTYRPAPVQ
jgi:hypothetical protein